MRSVLFIPGGNERMVAKAPGIAADVVAFDLEDAVPEGEKARAREVVRRQVPHVAPGSRAYCRVNGWRSGLTEDDLEVVVAVGLAGVCLPKCEGPEDVRRLDAALLARERASGLAPGSVAVQLFIESARGLHFAFESAAASARVHSLIFGAVDFARDLALGPEAAGPGVAHARASLALAARAAGCLPIDHVYADYRDLEGFERDTLEGRRLGYAGRLLVHPGQIERCHRVYAPAEHELAWARRLVAAFETEALARGLAVMSFEGRMVDLANYETARSLLAAVTPRDGGSGSGGG